MPVPDNAWIGEELLNPRLGETCYLFRIEARIGLPECLALSEYAAPGKACLLSLEEKKLEVPSLVMKRSTPLRIMVGNV